MSWFSAMLDRIFAVLGAIILMQFPMFVDQYTMRLSGHVEELQYQVQQIRTTANKTHKELETYIQKFIDSRDSDFSDQGKVMKAMVKRTSNLAHSLEQLDHSNVVTRPFYFLFYGDWNIIRSTYSSYQLGISISFESCFYALAGVLLGFQFYQFVSSLLSKIANGLKRARQKELKSCKTVQSKEF
ncbi:MAG: DUF2937 family protein [Chlamydiota bacterium]|nr:DUF2937 family protein [Chlamydiota bacterium]